MRVIDSRPERSNRNGWDAVEFIHNPAKQPPKVVAGATPDRRPTKKTVDTKPKVRPTCKKRPDSRKASSRGAGNSRAFVPWCK